jgi:hypothetical protein
MAKTYVHRLNSLLNRVPERSSDDASALTSRSGVLLILSAIFGNAPPGW